MKTIDLEKERLNLAEIIKLASEEPVLIIAPGGKEFCIAEADDFDKEVETLRASMVFQKFLEERSACKDRISLEEIESEIEQELGQ